MSDAPKIIDAPDTIWLNYGDIERDCTHAECYRDGDVTWCQEPVFDSDVKYVRADDATLARIAELERELAAEKERADYAWRNTNTIEKARQELERERDRFRSALSDIALAGMSLPIEVGDDEEAKRSFHANQAWRFIQIAAIAISPDAAIASEKENERG